jgi:magnesium-transporting ATPase (P-type)
MVKVLTYYGGVMSAGNYSTERDSSSHNDAHGGAETIAFTKCTPFNWSVLVIGYYFWANVRLARRLGFDEEGSVNRAEWTTVAILSIWMSLVLFGIYSVFFHLKQSIAVWVCFAFFAILIVTIMNRFIDGKFEDFDRIFIVLSNRRRILFDVACMLTTIIPVFIVLICKR